MKYQLSFLVAVGTILVLLTAGSVVISWGSDHIRLPKLEAHR